MSLASPDLGQIASSLRSDVFPRYLQEPGVTIGADDDLLNIFDSLQIVRMTVDLETLFHVRIRNDELIADNIGTLDRMTRFISRKLNPAS
jgi:acyl carrier protein